MIDSLPDRAQIRCSARPCSGWGGRGRRIPRPVVLAVVRGPRLGGTRRARGACLAVLVRWGLRSGPGCRLWRAARHRRRGQF